MCCTVNPYSHVTSYVESMLPPPPWSKCRVPRTNMVAQALTKTNASGGPKPSESIPPLRG